MARLLIIVLVWIVPWHVLGHALTNSHLRVSVEREAIDSELTIAARDLDAVLGLDTNADRRISDAEVGARRTSIAEYARERVEIRADGSYCPLTRLEPALRGAQVVLRITARCPAPARALSLRYDLFFEHDPAHQGLLSLTEGGRTRSGAFRADAREQTFVLDGHGAWWADMLAYFGQGVWHIWLGFDHLLFLLVLLLPEVVAADKQAERGRDARRVLYAVVKLVTCFTLAHTLTLGLAAFEIVKPPARWIEASIAASVLIVALGNLRARPARQGVGAAFAFGLIHGFGFANVLSALSLPRGTFALCLLGFNLGVEAGQLCIVAVFVPLAFGLRSARGDRAWGLRAGSMVVAAIAAVWLVERTFDVSLFERALRASARARLDHPLSIAGAGALCLACGALFARRLAALSRSAVTASRCLGWLGSALLALGLIASSRENDALAERAQAQQRLAARLGAVGDLPAAQEHYQAACRLFARVGDVASEADSHARIGDIELTRAEPQGAARAYRRALELRERQGDARGVALQYHNLHLAARLGGDPTQAALALRRAAHAAEQAGLSLLTARYSAELGRLYRDSRQLADATAALERAVSIDQTLGDEQALAENLEELGNVYKLRGELERAAEFYQRALRLKEALGETLDVADIHANSADIARRQGRRADAFAAYQRALTLYAAAGQARKAQRVTSLLAELGDGRQD